MRRRIGFVVVAALVAQLLLVSPPLAKAQTAQANGELTSTSAERLGGDPTAISVGLSELGFPVGADRVYLVSDTAINDARIIGSLRDGPVLAVPSCGEAPATVVDEVERLDPGWVIAVGAAGQVCDAIAEDAAGGRPTSRLPWPAADVHPPGADPAVGTSIAVSQTRHVDGQHADTLHLVSLDHRESAAAAAALDGPTLVVDPAATGVPAKVSEEVDRLGVDTVVAIGGTAIVSNELLAAVADGRDTDRVPASGGITLAVSRRRFGVDAGQQPADVVFLARTADHVVRAAATALDDGPVLTVPGNCGALNTARLDELRRLRPGRVIALGDQDAVCDAQLADAAAAAAVVTEITAPTHIVSADERTAIAQTTNDSVIFEAPPATLDTIGSGTVLVSEPAPNAPDGLLRRVTGVDRTGDTVTVQTTHAAITDAITNGVGGHLVPAARPDTAAVTTAPGVTLESVTAADPIDVERIMLSLDGVLHDEDGNSSTTDDQVTASGTLELAVVVDPALDVRDGRVERFKVAAGVEERLNADFSFGDGVAGQWERQLVSIPFKPITFTVGPVPVVVIPELRVAVEASADGTVDVIINTSATTGAYLGVEYTNETGWTNLSGPRRTATGSATIPGSDTTTARDGGVSQTLAFELYGVAGPNVARRQVLRLDSQHGGDPAHRLLLGNRADVGVAVNLPFIGDVLDYDTTLFEQWTLLWQHPEAGSADPTRPPYNTPPAPPPYADPDAPADGSFDILEHHVAYDGDRVELAVRARTPRPPQRWTADEGYAWDLDVRNGDQTAHLTVLFWRPFDTVEAIVVNNGGSIHCTSWIQPPSQGSVETGFDGTWHRVAFAAQCLQGSGLTANPTVMYVGVRTGDANNPIDTVPDGYTTDPDTRDGPIRVGDQATFEAQRNPPSWASGGDIPTSGPAADLYPPDFKRFGDLTEQQFLARHWHTSANTWRWPPNEGEAGPITPNTLEAGDLIDRFGPESGGYASPAGTPFPARSLPPSSVGREYHVYRVLQPLPSSVRQSEIAPWFEQPGGGTQYIFDRRIDYYLDNGYLEEVIQ